MILAGLPSAMAAKLVKPDVAVMAIVGDGGFMMNSQVGGTPHVNTCQYCQACTVAACCEAFMYVDSCMHVEGFVHMAHASSWISPGVSPLCQSRCRARSACHLKLTAQTEHHADFMKCDRLIRHHITHIACAVRGTARILGPSLSRMFRIETVQGTVRWPFADLALCRSSDVGSSHCRSWLQL